MVGAWFWCQGALPCQGMQLLVTLCDLGTAPGLPHPQMIHLSLNLVPSQHTYVPLWLLVSTRMNTDIGNQRGRGVF